MSLTPLTLYARLVDLDTYDGGTDAAAQVRVQRSNLGDKQNPPVAIAISTVTVDAVATHDQIFAWQLGHVKDGPGSIRIGVKAGTAFAVAVRQAMGGVTYQGRYHRYLLQLSRTGGAPYCASCWLEGVTINLAGSERGIIIQADDSFSAYTRGIIDHATYNGAPLRDVLGAGLGLVPVTLAPGPTGTTISGAYFPSVGGYDTYTPGGPTLSADGKTLLAYDFHTDATYPPFATTPVNADTWGDTPANAMLTALRAAAGQFYPDDPAPVGARAHYHVDPLNHVANAGRVGTVPKINLVGTKPDTLYEVDQTTTALFDASKLTIHPGTETMRGEFAGLFGSSTHGFPDGCSITAVGTIFDEIASTNQFVNPVTHAQVWYTCLPIVCCATGTGGGGVGYLLDKQWHRLSQVMDITSFAYDGTAKVCYVGTPHGVFTWTVSASDLLNVPQWTKVGTLDANVLRVLVPDVNTVWALADTGQGTTGVFQAPALGGEDNTSLGFGGYSRIAHGGNIIDLAGGINNLYTVDAADSTNLLYQGGPGTAPQKIAIPGGAGIVGIDLLPTLTSIVIRTTAGSDGIFAINFTAGAGSLINLNADGSLADSFGGLSVNSVAQSNAATLNGTPCTLVAATDQGMWFSSQMPGTAGMAWQRATAQTGVGDITIDFITTSPRQWVLGQAFEGVIVASATGLWRSRNGGVWFQDVLGAPLDLGPFWYALARKRLGTTYPDSGVGGIGGRITIDISSANLGQILDVPPSGPTRQDALPDNFVWVLRLTPGRNDYVFVLDVLDSPAPYFAVEQQNLTDITADDSRGAITAAQAGALAALRYMLEVAQPPVTLPLTGMSYWAQEAALPTLLTSDLAHLTYTDTQIGDDGTLDTVCDWTNLPVYIQTYMETLTNGIMAVDLTVGTVMAFLDTNQELLTELVAGSLYGLDRSNRYSPRVGKH